MTTTTKAVSSVASAAGALAGGPVRTRFFDGMFLTQADLETEQRYWRLKRRLTNRALGAGVAWGLRLVWHSDKQIFQLAPGYAIDCCGNDLVVECPTSVTARDLWARADPSLRAASPGVTANAPANNTKKATIDACVVLQYTESAEEPRTVQGDACSGPTGMCELSRVRETARLLLVPPPARCETPPERFLDDLQSFKDSLSSAMQAAVFPPQPAPSASSSPSTANLPAALTMTLKAGPSQYVNLPPAGSSTTAHSTVATDDNTNPTANTVTFQLAPASGWSFLGGSVVDQSNNSTLASATSSGLQWTYPFTFPANGTTTTFDFHVAGLQIAQASGGQQTTVSAEITGTIAKAVETATTYTLDPLMVATQKAESTGGTTTGISGCFDQLVPWGWAVDPSDGQEIARVLVLAAAYAILQELATAYPNAAQTLGTINQALWLALFDVDVAADPNGQTLTAVTALIQRLFHRWCECLVYPGPRCLDEHHGVYLGTCQLDRYGNVVSFDMWTNRRYVLTGPLLAHWANQFGIAPVDVIVGRFADALCCVGAQSSAFGGTSSGGGSYKVVPSTFTSTLPSFDNPKTLTIMHVGTTGSVATLGETNNAQVNYVGFSELAANALKAFTAPADGPKQVLAMKIAGGGTVALVVPAASTSAQSGSAPAGAPRAAAPQAAAPQAAQPLTADITAQLKAAGDSHVIARSRARVAGFVTGVLSAAPASSLVPDNAPSATQQLAKLLDAKGVTVAALAANGPQAALVQAGATGDATLSAGADDLVDRAELAVTAVTAATVKTVGSSAEAATFGDATKQKALAKALTAAVPKLAAGTVTAAATKAASAA